MARVLNNSCEQSLILSPSPLLWGTPSPDTIKLVATKCILQLPKLKSGSLPAVWTVANENRLVGVQSPAPREVQAHRALPLHQWGREGPELKRRGEKKRRGQWILWHTSLLAGCAGRTLSWCWINRCGINRSCNKESYWIPRWTEVVWTPPWFTV